MLAKGLRVSLQDAGKPAIVLETLVKMQKWTGESDKMYENSLLENVHCRILIWLQIEESDVSNSTPCLLVYSSVY